MDNFTNSPANDILNECSSIKKISSPFLLENMRTNITDYKLADYQYEKLIEEIRNFESHLDDNHEIALKLATFGESITIAVTNIGYYNPSLIVFYGIVDGNPATLIQHVNQLSFLMIAVPKSKPDRPPRRIGFDIGHDD